MANTVKDVKKINVADFMKGYNKLSSDELKKRYVKEKVYFNDYIDFQSQHVTAIGVVNASVQTKEEFKIDTVKRYFLRCIALIETFTNLTFDRNNSMDDFHTLERENLINYIITTIPQDVVESFDTMIQMVTDDVILNYQMNNSATGVINKILPLAVEIPKIIDQFNSMDEDNRNAMMDMFTQAAQAILPEEVTENTEV